MNGLDFLNLVIGLIFIYLLYSIAASTIWELVISISNLKGKMLKKWLEGNFQNMGKDNTKLDILSHPLISGLCPRNGKQPSYISSEIFSDVIVDLIINSSKASDGKLKEININTLKESLQNAPLNEQAKQVFMQYISEASGSLQKVKEKIGRWYDETQERLIALYKKKLQQWIFLIAGLLVIGTNADTINLATYLYNNPEARNTIANQVDQIVKDSTFVEKARMVNDTNLVDSIANLKQKELVDNIELNIKNLEKLNATLKETSLPLGWSDATFQPDPFWKIMKKIGGLLLTIFAVSLGSPFWFDILSKLANLRSSGNKPRTMPENKN